MPNRITVTVRHGFLTLEGTVEWMFQKAGAGSAVVYLDGVKGVSNLIQVKPSASAGQIKTDIDAALRRSAEVDAQASPSTAQSSRSRDMCAPVTKNKEAERAGWAARGVTRVYNLMVVAS